MNNRRIKLNIGRTVNLGQYESMRIDVGLECDINDDDIMEDEFENMFNKLQGELGIISDDLNDKLTNKPKEDSIPRRRHRTRNG